MTLSEGPASTSQDTLTLAKQAEAAAEAHRLKTEEGQREAREKRDLRESMGIGFRELMNVKNDELRRTLMSRLQWQRLILTRADPLAGEITDKVSIEMPLHTLINDYEFYANRGETLMERAQKRMKLAKCMLGSAGLLLLAYVIVVVPRLLRIWLG